MKLHPCKFALPIAASVLLVWMSGCGSIVACPLHELDVASRVTPLPDDEAPGPELHVRQPGDWWEYSIRRNQWEDGILFVLDGDYFGIIEDEPQVDPTGFETTVTRSNSSYSTCEGLFAYSSSDRDFQSQDESGATSLHGFSAHDESRDETRDETSFIIKPVIGRVRTNPEYVIGESRSAQYQYDNGTAVESTLTVEGVDLVEVVAGSFTAFRVKRIQYTVNEERETSTVETAWIAPELAVSILSYAVSHTRRADGTEATIEDVWELMDFSVEGSSR